MRSSKVIFRHAAIVHVRPGIKLLSVLFVGCRAAKASGPVNGDECYYWRTTGCQFGNKCRHRHVPDSKGIDKKPWHKVK